MAALQMLSRLASPVAFQAMPSMASCSLRASPSCSSNRESGSNASSGHEVSTSGSSLSIASGWARYTGSRRALTERGRPRAAATSFTESRSTESLEDDVVETRLDHFNLGCRPTYEEEAGAAVLDSEFWDEEAFRSLEARATLYASTRSMRDLEIIPSANFPLDFAEFVNDVWQQKATAAKYFEIALKRNPNDAATLLQYAQFAWKTLGDLDKAELLFCQAMQQEKSVHYTNVQATYAMFLWQTDV